MDFSRFQGPLAKALRRIFQSTTPDPWSKDIDDRVRNKDANPVCLNCLMPQERHYWICDDCGFPGGEYVNTMPFLHIFSLGELLRRGVLGKPEKKNLAILGFLIVSSLEYLIFAPIYWYWMYRKAIGRPICEEKRPEFDEAEN
jgi:hypothetical protein